VPCSLVEVYWCFRWSYSLHHQGNMLEAVSTSEMLVNFYKATWCNIPEDSRLHTRHCENLKSHLCDKGLTQLCCIKVLGPRSREIFFLCKGLEFDCKFWLQSNYCVFLLVNMATTWTPTSQLDTWGLLEFLWHDSTHEASVWPRASGIRTSGWDVCHPMLRLLSPR
jgi:hypothetical protein